MTIKEALALRNELIAKISVARREVMIALATIREAVDSYCADDADDSSRVLDAQEEYEIKLGALIELKSNLEQLNEMEVKD